MYSKKTAPNKQGLIILYMRKALVYWNLSFIYYIYIRENDLDYINLVHLWNGNRIFLGSKGGCL